MSKPRAALALSITAAMVCGALGAALYVTFTFSGGGSSPGPQPVTVHQVAATSAPTVTVTAKPVVKAQAKPAKKKAANTSTRKTTTTTTRSFVSTQNTDPAPTDQSTADVPQNGGGDGRVNPPADPTMGATPTGR